jgi:hypothetical protein
LGIRNTATSILPFKFQELELVGAFPRTFLGQHVVCSSFATEDPDVENAPVVPEMGTIELRVFRCQVRRAEKYREYRIPDYKLHQGRVSERSKKAGWHHVGYVLRPSSPRNSHPRVIFIDPPSTADEIPSASSSARHKFSVDLKFLDPRDAPYASVKVFYRPRGGSFHTLSYNLANAVPELLMAQGVISGDDVRSGNGNREGSEVNDRKRAREDGSPGPSKRHTRPTVKKEEISVLSQQIQALQVSRAN